MIVFEYGKYLKQIKRDGIAATDRNARAKIIAIMENLIANSTYCKGKILKIVKKIAADYFDGLPAELVELELSEYYESLKARVEKGDYEPAHDDKTIKLYQSEMRTIASLKEDKLMRLAFAALIVHKWLGQNKDESGCYRFVEFAEADIYRIARLETSSSVTKDRLWNILIEKGLVAEKIKTNSAWAYNPEWIAIHLFSVTFNVDIEVEKSDNAVFKTITNYDDVLNYLRFWLKDDNLVECADCGCPIDKGFGLMPKQYCSNCATRRKSEGNKARYQNSVKPKILPA
jgi:hypothetical protein